MRIQCAHRRISIRRCAYNTSAAYALYTVRIKYGRGLSFTGAMNIGASSSFSFWPAAKAVPYAHARAHMFIRLGKIIILDREQDR